MPTRSCVDRLLASPHYGERWARRWLDLARYADTNGYEKDRPRSIWPYRDWVIQALNADMPFDRFTIEQLAGDMLPGATLEQRIATGFHRNTMLNEEGGIDPLEFRFYAMTDRVATTATVWLGLTLGCAQCHTHKFDPIPHREYYQFMALLNNADEPEIEVPSPDVAQSRREIETKIAALDRRPSRIEFPLAARSRRRRRLGPSASAARRIGRPGSASGSAVRRHEAVRWTPSAGQGDRQSAASEHRGRRFDLRQRRPEQARYLHAGVPGRPDAASPRSGSRRCRTTGCRTAGRGGSSTRGRPATSS